VKVLQKIKKKRLEKNLQKNQDVTSFMDKTNWNGKNTMDKYIYSEIIWDHKDNKHYFKRYNTALQKEDVSILPSISSSIMGSYLRSPMIALKINWKDLIKEKYKLLSYKIEFSNYNSDPFVYSILMIAVKENGKQVCDSFCSTNSNFINHIDLLNNIKSFLKFAEKLKK